MRKQILPHTPAPIHYVVWESLPGGMESYISHYTNRFYGQRELFIYSLRPVGNELDKRLDEQHYDEGADNNFDCYTGYLRYCRAHRNDLFHLMNSGPIVLLLTLLAGVRNPVYHIHGTKYWKKWWNKIYLKTCWLLCALFRVRYIANSRYSAGIFRREVLPIQPRVIYNGFHLSQFLEKRWLRSRLRKLAYIGRFDTGKNTHLVIRLFEAVAAEMPELELHLAGQGGLRPQLEEQARNSPFADRIVFHGWVEDVSAFYASVDLFVFLSAYESFGNVLPEALLTGLPILTSSVPVFEEIHGGEAAFCLGNPDNFEEILKNFRRAISDYPALAQKAYAAAERLQGLFDLEFHLKEIEKTYETA
ncbi:MAG: glycosyltransferase family 4 protein [Saprospiraceae bacterium]|nr:glycosyltransferase family 4 protein [Saprospiraceae bacterium]